MTPIYSVDPNRLEDAGWAILFGPGVTEDVKAALAPLLQLRKEQSGDLYQELSLTPGTTWKTFRQQYGLGFGPADPAKLPYYLLLVGDPRDVPFELQCDLDIQYAVGRLHLDEPDDYARYASAVRKFDETVQSAREAVLFGVVEQDRNNFLIHSLVDPLFQTLVRRAEEKSLAKKNQILRVVGKQKAHFSHLLKQSPGLLFAAGHGLHFSDPESPHLPRRQGALVFPGYPKGKPVESEFFFSGEDIPPTLDLNGLVALFFASYSAGVPRTTPFEPNPIAPYPMISYMAKRMLSQGALAFVGHFDRAWHPSFGWTSRREQTMILGSVIGQLLDGGRLGHSMEWVNHRYAEAALGAARLADTSTDEALLTRTLKATFDARNYIVAGDPAVRVPGF